MTLTKFVRASAAIVGALAMATQVNAADLYSGGMKDAPVFRPPPTWTGFYLGAHVGGAWGELKNNYYDDFFVDTYRWKNTNDGVFGGGTAGYNFQTGAFVFGFEADFGGIGFSNTSWYDNLYWSKQPASFYADVTGRLGYAAGPALFYAKGGWAYLDNPGSFGWGSYTAWNDGSLNGWTIGGGIEYMWSPSWSVKAEYLYFDFGKKNFNYDYTVLGIPFQDTYSEQLTINTFKVGLNYHFNSVYTPLK